MANERYEAALKDAENRYEKLMNRIMIVKQFLADCKGSGVSAINKATGGCTISYNGQSGTKMAPVKIVVAAAGGKGITKIEASATTLGEAKTYAFTVAGAANPFKISLDAGDSGAAGADGKYIEDDNLKHPISLTGASASATGCKASATGVSMSMSICSVTIDVFKFLFNASSVSLAALFTDFHLVGGEVRGNEGNLDQTDEEGSVDDGETGGIKGEFDPVTNEVGTSKTGKWMAEVNVPGPSTQTETNVIDVESGN